MNAPAKEFKWKMSSGGTCFLYAAQRAGERLPKDDTFDGTRLLASVFPYGDNGWRADYWKLEPVPEGYNDDPLLRGDWIEFPGEHTKEEAIALAEAAVLLNLGGWP